MSGVRVLSVILVAAALAAAASAGDDDRRPGTRVVVTGADGKPAADATVIALNPGGFDAEGGWLSADDFGGSLRGPNVRGPARSATTDVNGVATLSFSTSQLCLFASRDGEAALHCAVAESKLEDGTTAYALKLEPAKAITGRLLGADGKPVAGARLRLAVAGEQEWHFLDADLAADGTYRLPPVPGRLLRNPESHIEARAPRSVEAHVAVGEKDAGRAVDVRFVRARVLRGKLHVEGPIHNASVRTSDVWHGPRAKPGADGSFAMDGISPATRRVYVVSRSHATRIIEVPAGNGDADLGVIEVEPGRAVSGKIVASDGAKPGALTVGLVDDQGWELATMDTDVRGVYDFAHVGAGADHLVARAGGAGGEIWLFERGKLGGEMPVPPFALKFQDPAGRPALVEVARLKWTAGASTETSIVRMVSYTLGVRTVRMRLPGPGSLRVEIEGSDPVVLDKVEVAADGTGEATVTVGK